MKKILTVLFVICLTFSMAACGESSEEPEEKTTLMVDEIAEGEYIGELSGCSYSNESQNVFSDIEASDFTATVKDGEITFNCETVGKSRGVLNGEDTPDSSEYDRIISGTLPLEQNGENKVSAEGEVAIQGESVTLYTTDGQFDRWEIQPVPEGKAYDCTINIEMRDGIPVAKFKFQSDKNKDNLHTCTLPLKLKVDTSSE